MHSQQPRPTGRIDPVPERIESAQAKLVYLYLETMGTATADEIGETLTMKKIDVLSVLNTLSSEEYVEKNGDEYAIA